MTLEEKVIYSIEIEDQHVGALINLMIQLEKGINASALSNHITIDFECKNNKQKVLELVKSFNNEVKIDNVNIAADPHQTKELD